MNPVAAHRLLNAPTHAWTAYLTNNPNWGYGVSQCLRAGTVSPLAVTNNLRKLTDCMAEPNIQPLLCDWFSKNFAPHEYPRRDKVERVQGCLSKCVRSLQLQAIHHGNLVNILPRIDHLAALSGNPLENNACWNSWVLLEDDIYTTSHKKNEYFTHGKSLGGKENLQKTLSQYQKFVVEAMAQNPAIAKDLKTCFSIETTASVAGGTLRMAHALLWEHNRLSTPLKYALAHDWANDSSAWATREHDRILSPRKTQYWDAWASHAKIYLHMSCPGPLDFHAALAILQTCPPLPKNKEKFDNLDNSVFSDALVVV